MLKTQKVTAIPYEGKVSIHDRAIYQSVARAMQGNITMALIELMTNSNDSYGRIGIENGKIIISYKKSRFKCKFSVKDEAEGQSLADFYENFTKYWKPSDVTGDSSQRGYFGKGAKDALGYMDEGEIASFKGLQMGDHVPIIIPQPFTDGVNNVYYDELSDLVDKIVYY